MNVTAPGALVLALTFFMFLFRRESCHDLRRHWRQGIAISGLLLIAAIARAVVFRTRGADCGFEWAPSVSVRNK